MSQLVAIVVITRYATTYKHLHFLIFLILCYNMLHMNKKLFGNCDKEGNSLLGNHILNSLIFNVVQSATNATYVFRERR